jgi:hypothetical protein
MGKVPSLVGALQASGKKRRPQIRKAEAAYRNWFSTDIREAIRHTGYRVAFARQSAAYFYIKQTGRHLVNSKDQGLPSDVDIDELCYRDPPGSRLSFHDGGCPGIVRRLSLFLGPGLLRVSPLR